jgi:hypothetical protein
LEVELTGKSGTTSVERRTVPSDRVAKAQRIIASAVNAIEADRNKAIDKSIQLFYPYKPREGQRDALRQLIYQRKDLILIARTSFEKSMILRAVSVLICRSITVVILPLDQFCREQAEYITSVGGRPCRLNADTINLTVLKQVQDMQYTHILISLELAISDKFHNTAIHPAFKQQLALVVVDDPSGVTMGEGLPNRLCTARPITQPSGI